jgi:amino acid adenylation domain-containing protein/non-ribosomal peptide synthase protein (TIGR01720 family)
MQTQLPLASPQRGIWLDQRLHADLPLYNLGVYIAIDAALDIAVFESAVAALVRRHDALRTRLHGLGGEQVLPWQDFSASVGAGVGIRDLSAERNPDAAALSWMRQRIAEPFALDGPLFRIDLVRLSAGQWYCLMQYHHLIADGYSMAYLTRALADLYQRGLAGAGDRDGQGDAGPRPSCRDYIVEDQAYRESPAFEADRAYWLDKHRAPPAPLYSRRGSDVASSGQVSLSLPRELWGRVEAFAGANDSRPLHVFLAALYLYFTRCGHRDELAIGLPMLNRPGDAHRQMAGCCASINPARFAYGRDLTFLDLLGRIGDDLRRDRAHARFPVEEVARHAGAAGTRSPLYDITLSYQRFDYGARFGAAQGRARLLLNGWEQTPLAIYFNDFHVDDDPQILLSHNPAYLEREDVEALALRLPILLEGVLASPTAPIDALPLMPESELARICALARPRLQHRPETTLVQGFDAQAARTPERIAVGDGHQALTYAELGLRAERVAAELLARTGGGGVLIGVCLERAVDLVVGLLGILKAGAAYVPIDLSYPPERVALMLEDSKAPLILTQTSLAEHLPPLGDATAVYLDRIDLAAGAPAAARLPTPAPDDLAYVLYTSGSTGQPKGCRVTHRNVCRLFTATEHWFGFNQDDVWTLFHSTAFDFSVWELWGALLYGGQLVVVPYWVSRSPDDFYDLLIRERVTVLNQTPTAFKGLIQVDRNRTAELALRWVIFGGEALNAADLAPWFRRHGDARPRLVNMYGITETTVHVTYYPLTAADTGAHNRIGCPIPDLGVHVLDAAGRPTPFGVPGELHVVGGGVSQGYLDRPELTAKRFIEIDCCGRRERAYRTGDLGCWRSDGQLEYLGRIDRQVKLRGFRIELGEIEAALLAHPAVAQAVVLLIDVAGAPALAAWLVLGDGADALDDIRDDLARRLPEYMVPTHWMPIAELPRTSNGKLDQNALPTPTAMNRRAFEPPVGHEECLLAETWEQVLEAGSIGRRDHFFERGGDSIRAIEVVARVKQAGYRLAVQDLFATPVLCDLARTLVAHESVARQRTPFCLLDAQERAGIPAGIVDAYPLATLQAGMVFHSQLDGEHAVYHDVFTYHLRSPLDATQLRAALAALVARHPILRTSLHLEGAGRPLQWVQAEAKLPLVVAHIDHLDGPAQQRAIEGFIEQEKRRTFDWRVAPLARIFAHVRGPETFNLSLSFHHAILDGWSLARAVTELLGDYWARMGYPAPRPAAAPGLCYRDFIALEQEAIGAADHRAFWRERLRGCTATRLPRPAAGTAPGRVRHDIPLTGLGESLWDLAQRLGVPLKAVLLTGYLRVIGLFANQHDVVVGAVVNGRPEEVGGEQVLGLFLNSLPVRLELAAGASWAALIQAAAAAEEAQFAHRRFPLAEIQRDFGGAVFEALFNYTHFHVYQALDGLDDAAILGQQWFEQTNFTLSCNALIKPSTGELGLYLVSDTGVLGADQVAHIGRCYGMILGLMAADVQAPHDRDPILTPEDSRLLREFGSGGEASAAYRPLAERFAEQAMRRPDAPAVVCGEASLSWRQLDARSTALAGTLRALRDADGEALVGTDTLVAVCLDRCLDLVVAVLGIVKAGAAYVPVDPGYPAERIGFLLEDSRAPVVLSCRRFAGRLPALGRDCRLLLLDDPAAGEGGAVDLQVPPATATLYAIYTSGSTGRPKGAACHQAGFANLLDWYQDLLRLGPADTVMMITSPSFDLTQKNLFTPLVTGATLQLAPGDRFDPAAIGAAIARTATSCINCTPSMFYPLVDAARLDDYRPLASLKWVILGGEPIDLERLAEWRARSSAQIVNSYGPTECTDVCTYHVLPQAADAPGPVPIGRPLPGVTVHILNERRQSLPAGVAGELCLSGVQVGRGYLHRPELTAERFVTLDLPGGRERLYRTGDLARFRADGCIDYLGRLDHQVKLRGFRIELGEIEHQLSRHDAVAEAVCVVRRDDGPERLVAYVRPGPGASATSLGAGLTAHLEAGLPEYMIPRAYVVVDRFPLTPNGKVDRSALPAPETGAGAGVVADRSPLDPTETLLARLWSDVLGCEGIGRDADFFALGGHSLSATQLATRIRAELGVEVGLQAIFDQPRLGDMAAVIARAGGAVALPAVVAQPPNAPRVLSFTQQRLWFLSQWEGVGEGAGRATYNMPLALDLTGPLDPDALRRSLHWVIERHAVLRQCFPAVDGAARVAAVADERLEQVFAVRDLTGLAGEDAARAVAERARAMALTAFDMERGPLLAAELLVLDGQARHGLLLTLHHIVGDGWSWGMLLDDLRHAYAAFSAGDRPTRAPLALQFSDYAAWERQVMGGERIAGALAYWREQLADAPALLELPGDRPRPPHQSFRGAHLPRALPGPLRERVEHWARGQGATLFMALLSAYTALLSRWSGQHDLCIGSPIANRRDATTEDMVGPFVNTLVLRGRLSPATTAAELLAATRATCLGAYAHQDLPFDLLVEHLQPQRSTSHGPLFQAMFALFDGADLGFTLPGLASARLEQAYPVAKFDLTLGVELRPCGLHCVWECATDLFDEATVARMAGHYEVLLEAMLADPARPIATLPLMTAAEQAALAAWNATDRDYPAALTVVDLFDRAARSTPAAPALVCDGQTLSYGELAARADRLAGHLRGLLAGIGRSGACADRLVALCAERSPALVVGLLGILKAGAAAVPIDPEYPAERIRLMLADSDALLVVTEGHLAERLAAPCPAVLLDEPAGGVAGVPVAEAGPGDLAYVIYTSGSTGRPKGVAVEHGALALHVDAMVHQYAVTPADRVLQFASFSFDIALEQCLLALTTGACSVMIRTNLMDPGALLAIMRAERVTIADFAPAYWQQMLAADDVVAALDGLRVLILGGEALPVPLARATRERFPALVCCNSYGPTEAVIAQTVYRLPEAVDDAGAYVSIGRPRANSRIHILDAAGQPRPPGLPGELYIAGGLARGYLNRPDLTAERFVELDLGGCRERIYRTGDLARWCPDGRIEFLGRLDDQIKLRGFRIELGEIESVLAQHPAVEEAVAVVRGDGARRRLVAYVTPAGERPVAFEAALDEHAHGMLPDYMVPGAFVVLDRLPLTHNGKVDRQALPDPLPARAHDYEAPRNAVEHQLAEAWQDVLGRSDIGVHDNFFALGGDSILSIQIVAAARRRGLFLEPRDLFEHQSIAALAGAVRFAATTRALQGSVSGDAPLTPIQDWYLTHCTQATRHFSQAVLLRVPADIDRSALRRAFAAVLAHHDALRLRFAQRDGRWQARFAPPPASDEVVLRCEDLPGNALGDAWLQATSERLARGLDMTRGPLTAAALLVAGDQARLYWCAHHLGVDGVSWRILVADLEQAYAQAAAGQPIVLSPKTSSWQDWARRLTERGRAALADERDYWQGVIGAGGGADATADAAPAIEHYHQRWDRDATRALLEEAPGAYRTRINDLLLAALALAWRDLSGQPELLVDLEGHGRAALFDDLDLSRTVGWFTTVYPVALRLPRAPGDAAEPGAAIKAVKEQLRAVPNDGVGFGVTREAGESLAPAAVLFNYLGQLDQGVGAGLMTFAPEAATAAPGPMDHRIEINGMVSGGCLRLAWSYDAGRVAAGKLADWAERFAARLEALIDHCRGAPRGLTPSDVPLAGLAQAQLDRLWAAYPGLVDVYPLSPLQQGMLFHALYEPADDVYVEQLVLALEDVDPDAYRAAWQQQIARHPIWRTLFVAGDPRPLQVFLPAVELQWRSHDWSDLPAAACAERLDALLAQERAHGFDLSRPPLVRFDMIRAAGSWQLVCHHHHILVDGWSLPLILAELRETYRLIRAGQALPAGPASAYREHIAWLARQDIGAARSYWRERLAGLEQPSALPIWRATDAGRPAPVSVTHRLGSAASARLRDFAREHRLTLSTLFQGAWCLLVGRYTSETDVCCGVTVSGRHAGPADIERMIGLFINTVPLRARLADETPVVSFLRDLQRGHQEDQLHASLPLHEIQTASGLTGATALFDTLLVFENYPLDALADEDDGGYRITGMHSVERTNYPLTLAVDPSGDELAVRLDYDARRTDGQAMERLWGHLATLLEALAADPERALGALALLTEEEERRLAAASHPACEPPSVLSLVDWLGQRVAAAPEAIALVCAGETLSYGELSRRVDRVARTLRGLRSDDGERLVGAEALVALYAERSLDLVAGLIGILKAGAAYVPIDPDTPLERIRWILDDSAAPVVVADAQIERLPADSIASRRVLRLDRLAEDSDDEQAPLPKVAPDQLAYVIYTSGSTGRPKGCLVTHRNVCRLFRVTEA